MFTRVLGVKRGCWVGKDEEGEGSLLGEGESGEKGTERGGRREKCIGEMGEEGAGRGCDGVRSSGNFGRKK